MWTGKEGKIRDHLTNTSDKLILRDQGKKSQSLLQTHLMGIGQLFIYLTIFMLTEHKQTKGHCLWKNLDPLYICIDCKH